MSQEKTIRTRIIAFVFSLLVILVAIFVAKYYFVEAGKKPKAAKASVVEFAKVNSKNWYQQVYAIGTVVSRKAINLRAEVKGRVVKIFVSPGEQVTKGQALFQIYPQLLIAKLAADRAALNLSQFEFERRKKLYQKQAVSLEAVTSAKSQFNLNKANVSLAKEQLKLATIYAPDDGAVGFNVVNQEQFVTVGEVLASFQTRKNLRVDFSVPQRYAHSIKVSDKVTLKNKDKDITAIGRVFAIDASVSPDTHTLALRASVDNVEFIPGSYVDVILDIGQPKQVLIIPQTAVVKSLHGDMVYKVVNGKAVATFVQTGQRRGKFIEIKQGLKLNDTVISAGLIKIRNKTKVTEKGAIKP